ncbi:cytochrome P450 71D10-like [Apium graveolens]|uniref:cytochrome P450 71D10-like n=1 Tax=Apium graveolens TaxID=4045 RepID=UPI003D7A91B1
MSLKFGEVSAIVVSSPEVAQEVLKTHDIHLAQRPYFVTRGKLAYNFSDNAFSLYVQYWGTLRKICTMELFNVKSIQKFRVIRESVSYQLTTISQNVGKTTNVGKEFFTLTTGIVARAGSGKRVSKEIKGVSYVDQEDLVDVQNGGLLEFSFN